MFVIDFDITHRRRNVRVIKQCLRQVNIAFWLPHQIGSQRVSKPMRRHPNAKRMGELFEHVLNLMNIHRFGPVVDRKPIHIK